MKDKKTTEYDHPEELENPAAANKLPLGWLLLFVGLIVVGVYYFFAYTPSFSGWSQSQAFEESIKK